MVSFISLVSMTWQEFVFRINGYPLSRAKSDLKKIRSIPENEFERYQQDAANTIARHHYNTNLFYRSKVGDSFPKHWEDLPIMEKTDYQVPLASMLANGYTVKNVFTSKTSGSSGHPMYFARDKYSHARNWAYVMERYKGLKIPVGSRTAWFYGIPKEWMPRFKERFKDWLMNRYRFVVFDLSPSVLEGIVGKFKTDSFHGIYGYTHSIVFFAQYLLETKRVLKDLCPDLKSVIVTSEVCTEEDRSIMTKAFGVPVSSEYGASEFGYIGFDIGHDRWRIARENLLVEVVPINGLPIAEFGGRILVTDFNNKAFPFIRFSIGDIGTLEIESGKLVPDVITRLMGRTNDMAILPSGKNVPGLVFYYVSKSIIEKAKGIRQYVIRQRRKDTFEFIIESTDKLERDVEIAIEKDIIGYLEKGLYVTYTYVDTIEKTTNGKIKHFYSDIKV
jgi:phenylacetate-CoA ligase